MSALKYLTGYSQELQEDVRKNLAAGRLGEWLANKYPEANAVRTDKALYDYVQELKMQYLRSAEPLSKIHYDNKIKVIAHALGTHTTISRVQGSKLKSKREIRIASVFKDAPADFLKMIVVHELAHLKERDHNKAFYSLCTHMTRDYFQLEFDFRVYLTLQEFGDVSV